MQVFYERLIIPRFRLIARSSRGTVLEDLCNRLAIDDGIHHGAGIAYERVLLANADRRTKQRLVDAANRMLPLFVSHSLWRPKAREFVGTLMRETDIRRLREDVENGVRLAASLGIDVGEIELPALVTATPGGGAWPTAGRATTGGRRAAARAASARRAAASRRPPGA